MYFMNIHTGSLKSFSKHQYLTVFFVKRHLSYTVDSLNPVVHVCDKPLDNVPRAHTFGVGKPTILYCMACSLKYLLGQNLFCN